MITIFNKEMSASDKQKIDRLPVNANSADVEYNSNSKTITKTINGTTSNVVSVTTLKSDLNLNPSDVRLGNVNNTSDLDKPISTATQTALDLKLDNSLKGHASGLAELDGTGKVPSSQLPSYVDDVLEFLTRDDFPLTGESGKIYINLADNTTYRWGGSTYVAIGSSLSLGETSSTAYRGDRGKEAYDHAYAKGSAYSAGLYKITTNQEGHVTNATMVNKVDITSLGIPDQNTTYSLRQDQNDRRTIIFEGSDDSTTTITIPSSGTVTNVSTGIGLTGGPITNTGTIKVNLANETNLTNAALNPTEIANRIYPVRLDSNDKLAVVVPWSESQSYDTTISISSEQSQISLAANTRYELTAGGSSFVFTTPPGAVYSAISDEEIEALFA